MKEIILKTVIHLKIQLGSREGLKIALGHTLVQFSKNPSPPEQFFSIFLIEGIREIAIGILRKFVGEFPFLAASF